MTGSGGIGTYLSQLLPHIKAGVKELTLLDFPKSVYSLGEQVILPRVVPSCDLFWSPHFNAPILPTRAKKRVVTIHDLYHLDGEGEFSLAKKMGVRALLHSAVSRSDQIITVSQFSKGRLLHYFPRVEKKVEVIHSGADHLDRLSPAPLKGLPDRFFLFVGNLKPHKNLELICRALETQTEDHLVVAGQVGGFLTGVNVEALMSRYPGLEKRIHFIGKVSDQTLVWLYDHAAALLFPSLYEGWGLPPLEAMRRGCPVIASNRASIPEAVGGGAILIDPEREGELIEAMRRTSFDLREVGRARAANFTWQRAAEKHLEAFARICHRAG